MPTFTTASLRQRQDKKAKDTINIGRTHNGIKDKSCVPQEQLL